MPDPCGIRRMPAGLRFAQAPNNRLTKEDLAMQWIDPAYCDIRLGFEVTAYVYVR